MTHRWQRVAATLLLPVLLVCLPGAVPAADGPLEHVVIVWLKDPGNTEHRQRIIGESQVLAGIPGVLSLKSGSVVQSERDIVDSSFDVALVVSFENRAALDDYLVHPLHVRLVEQTLKPLVDRIRVYDFR